MPSTEVFDAIGTRWQIDIVDELTAPQRDMLMHEVESRIATFDKAYSRFRSDSWVTQLSRAAGIYDLPPDAEPLFSLYEDLYRHTNGAFTPLIGDVLVDAGYDAEYSLKPGVLQAPPAWDDVITRDAKTLLLQQPAMLDFGAAGKGYLIDLVRNVLDAHGVTSYCIDAGGDMLQRSSVNGLLRVGLEDPENTGRVIGVATIANRSICGSAGNRRAWAEYHHIIDPRTLASPRDILATWVIAETTMLADAIATCLFLVPPAQLIPHYPFSYLILHADRTVEQSRNFPVELFV